MQVQPKVKRYPASVKRLLGPSGVSVLARFIACVVQAAGERQLPLVRIEVEHYRDPEIQNWEYALVWLIFAASFDEAAMHHRSLYPALDAFQNGLAPDDKKVLVRLIYFDFATAS